MAKNPERAQKLHDRQSQSKILFANLRTLSDSQTELSRHYDSAGADWGKRKSHLLHRIVVKLARHVPPQKFSEALADACDLYVKDRLDDPFRCMAWEFQAFCRRMHSTPGAV